MTNINTDKNILKIGGLATFNGILLQSKRFWVLARRNSSNKIDLNWGRTYTVTSKYPWLADIPILRSAVFLLEGIFNALARTGAKKSLQKLIVLVLFVGVLAEVLISNRLPENMPRLYAISQLLPLPLIFILIRLTQLSEYHGAEHKAIAAYENIGCVPSLTQIAGASRFHSRCGTNLVLPLIFGFGLAAWFGWSLLIQLLLVFSTVEVFRYVTKNPLTLFSKGYLLGGFALQRITTKEPDNNKLEVAESVLSHLLELEEQFKIRHGFSCV